MLASDEKTQGCHGNRIIVYKIILYLLIQALICSLLPTWHKKIIF